MRSSLKKGLAILANAALIVAGLVFFSTPAQAAVALNANGVSLNFNESSQTVTNYVGNGKTAGSVVKYGSVATISSTVVDAVIETVSVTGATVNNFDGGNAVGSADQFFQTDVTTSGAGSVVYKFSFFVGGTYTGVGTGTAVILQNVYINSYDIDASQNGNNQYTQFTGVQSYTMSNNTTLAVSAAGNLLQFINNLNGASYTSTNGSYTKGRVQVKYDNLSTINIKVGTDAAGSGGANYFALDFSVGLAWTEGATTISTTTVTNSFNSPPTSANDTKSVTQATAAFVTSSDFGVYADPDQNPWVSVSIETLPAGGTLQWFNGTTWVNVTAGQVITVSDLDANKLRYTSNAQTSSDSFTFKVSDGLASSVAAYTLAITATGGGAQALTPQVITFAQPADSDIAVAAITVAPTADSGLTVTLSSTTPGVCTVAGFVITFVTTGSCSIAASQGGDSTFSAASNVTQTFQITTTQGPAPVQDLPAAPDIDPTAGKTTGTNLVTMPIPVNRGTSGANCLIDPRDLICKATVTIAGKGTFLMLDNGQTTFKAVEGFFGIISVEYRVTDSYGRFDTAPVTVEVLNPNPNQPVDNPSDSQSGSTTGTTPVVLTPNTAPGAGAEICLIDPADNVCKTKVTVPGVGTWTQAPNGTVSFAAVKGYVGSNTVIQRVTRASIRSTSPFTVTVAKSRGPVTVTISGFADGSPVLTAAIRAKINAFLRAYVDYKKVLCIGYTEGPTVLKTDAALSRQRAINGCAFVKSGLGKKLTLKSLTASQGVVEAAKFRRITITLSDN